MDPFLAVGEASNFTKAAAQLGVAQPALSRQVKDLEDEIGVDLLRRSPRGVTLTPEGKIFLAEVRELLERTTEPVKKVIDSEAIRLARNPGYFLLRQFWVMGNRDQYGTQIRCLLFAKSCLKTILSDPPLFCRFLDLSDSSLSQRNQAIPSILGIRKECD
jgi:DNA-binding MarR family transcriptional regulator